MCFSAPVSFVAGGVLTAGGVMTLKKVRDKTELPFALFPLIFGIQQIIEGFVWVSFGSVWFNTAMSYAFVLFPHVFWPIWLPFAIMTLEHDQIRRKILVFFFGIGVAVGFSQLYIICTVPVYSLIAGNSIVYIVPESFANILMILYLMTVCLCCAFSSHRYVKIFGLALFISFFIAFQFYTVSCFSVWCFFSALLSVIIYLHFSLRPPPDPPLKKIKLPKIPSFIK